jgi:hypothetical protein
MKSHNQEENESEAPPKYGRGSLGRPAVRSGTLRRHVYILWDDMRVVS